MISKMIWIRQVMQLKDNQVDGSTETGGTGSILIDGILNEREDPRAVNNITHTNDGMVQIIDTIDCDSDSDEVLNAICKVKLLWRMMNRSPISKRKDTGGTS